MTEKKSTVTINKELLNEINKRKYEKDYRTNEELLVNELRFLED